MSLTLHGLLGGDGMAALRTHLEQGRRLHVRPGAAREAAALLPWETFDRLIASDAVPPGRLRVMLRNREADRSMYRDAATGALRSDAVQTMAAQGATLVVNLICNLCPPIGEMAAAIERRLDRNVLVNCYASFGEHSAFEIHADEHDVLVLQVHGAKHWRCYGADDTPEWDGVIEEGDVLFVPQGERHAAAPVRRPSVHLTFAILRPAADEAARRARRELRRVAVFNIAGRLDPSLVLVPALRRRIDLRPDDPAELELLIGGRAVRLVPLPRRALHALVEADRLAFGDLAAGIGRAPDDEALHGAVIELARKGLIGAGA